MPKSNNGRMINVDEAGKESHTQRPGKEFVPSSDTDLDTPPEAITAGEGLPRFDDYSGIQLSKSPLKGLKAFLILVLVFVVFIISWESYRVVSELAAHHWILATVFVLIVAGMLGLGGRLLLQLVLDRDNLGTLGDIQAQLGTLRLSRAKGNANELVSQLQNFYANKPQAPYLKRCLDQLPDYSDDSEIVAHIEQVFVAPLDEEAKHRIAAHSAQIGSIVALSPWATVDIAFAFWRNLKMLEDITQIYGIRPTLPNRIKLARMVLEKLAFVGGSQALMDLSIKHLESAGLVIPAAGAVAQGIGASIYSARIGILAMGVSRPICFLDKDQPNAKDLIGPLIDQLRSRLDKETHHSSS